MTFRRGARLDPRQVRDLRGGTGLALGGGIGGVVLIALFLLLGGDPSQVPIDSLANTRVGTGEQTDINTECQTDVDANTRDDCRIVGYVNSVQAYWTDAVEGYQLAPTAFFEGGVSTGCGQASSAVGPFYCPTTPPSTSTLVSSSSWR